MANRRMKASVLRNDPRNAVEPTRLKRLDATIQTVPLRHADDALRPPNERQDGKLKAFGASIRNLGLKMARLTK